LEQQKVGGRGQVTDIPSTNARAAVDQIHMRKGEKEGKQQGGGAAEVAIRTGNEEVKRLGVENMDDRSLVGEEPESDKDGGSNR